MDCSPPGSSVHWILQVKILERVSIPSSRGSRWPRDGTLVSYISCHAGRFSTINATCAVCLVYVWATMCLVAHSCVWLSVTPQTTALQAPLCMGFSGKNPSVGCHVLLQGIFPTQWSNPGLWHCFTLWDTREAHKSPQFFSKSSFRMLQTMSCRYCFRGKIQNNF